MTDPITEPLTDPTEIDARLRALAATEHLLVALDFDGTLSPLEDEPMDSRMHPDARRAVTALLAAPATTVALVSGRSLGDLRLISEHTDDSSLLLAGSHGAEFWVPGSGMRDAHDDEGERAARDALRTHAEQATAAMAGVWIEPKTFGFGVHTRRADAATAAAARDLVDGLIAAEAPHWRRRAGHGIVEYAFRTEGKDTGVAVLRELTGATAALFAGDDVTDEDALRALGPDDLGVRVGPGDTAARVRVADIPACAALLARLAVLRGA